jgi:hypothetical protein
MVCRFEKIVQIIENRFYKKCPILNDEGKHFAIHHSKLGIRYSNSPLRR